MEKEMQALFNHLADEHNAVLLENELEAVVSLCRDILEARLSDALSLPLQDAVIFAANVNKSKAAQYDALAAKIAECYGPEQDDADLGTIGEIAARHFGWI